LDEFIPLPSKAEERHRFMARYGKLSVNIFDPYSIALSKLDRGFEADIEDIVFLIKRGLVSLTKLEAVVQVALPHAKEFDLNTHELQDHLKAVRDEIEDK
jgi:hypothetical protein